MAQTIREALHVPKKRRPTKPSRGVVERRLRDKKQRSQTKKQRQRVDDE
jgi:ribosome-associated protein